MLTLLELLCLLVLAPIYSNTVTLTGAATNGDPCREAKSLEPLITVGLIDGADGFCPTTTTATKQCCSASAWTTLFPQSWTRLASPFSAKLVTMEMGLRKGIEDLRGLNCPSGSDLQATTLSVLNQLATSKWIQLLNTTTSPECRLKVVQSVFCPGTCDPNMPFKLPCRNLCLNTLRGCVGELARLALPWKHVMNSVRTAVRLLATTVKSGCTNPSAVDSFLRSLSTWREPLQWLDNGCEELPYGDCYNGREVGSYTKGVSPLGASLNPEFPFSEFLTDRSLTPQVQEFKMLLDSVTQTLSYHWPRLPPEDPTMSSDQLEDDFGSGDGGFNPRRRFFDTDDEDLLVSSDFGSGSGIGEGEKGDFGLHSDDNSGDLLEESTESSRTNPPSEPDSPPPSSAPPRSSRLSLVFVFGAIILLCSACSSHRTFSLWS